MSNLRPMSYADAVKKVSGPSTVSSGSSVGHPFHEGVISKRNFDLYVATNFQAKSQFKEYVSATGVRPVCREVLQALRQMENGKSPTESEGTCINRIKNWVVQACSNTDSQMCSSTPAKTRNTPDVCSLSPISCPPKGTENSGASKKSGDQKPLLGGLRNHGETCYLNCALQLLVTVREVVDEIQRTRSFAEEPIDAASLGTQMLMSSLRQIFSSMQVFPVTDTLPIHEDLKETLGLDRVNAQQDSQEVFSGLCTVIHGFFSLGNSKVAESMLKTSILSRSTCMECGFSRDKIAQDWILSLGLEESYPVTLEHLLKNSLECEYQRGKEQVDCDKCGKKTDTKRQYGHILEPSRYMLIHLKRFVFNKKDKTAKKIGSRVTLPEKLDVNFMRSQDCLQNIPVYEMKAVVLHYGAQSPSAGHYFILRNTSRGWFKFDDAVVTKVSDLELKAYREGRILNTTPYLVLYGLSSDSDLQKMPMRAPSTVSKPPGSIEHKKKSLSLKKINPANTRTLPSANSSSFRDGHELGEDEGVKTSLNTPKKRKERKETRSQKKQPKMSRILDALNSALECDTGECSDPDEPDHDGPKNIHSDSDEEVVPRKKHPAYSKMSYHHFEGKFSVKKEVWNKVWNWKTNSFTSRRKWVLVLKDYIKEFRPLCKHTFVSSGAKYEDVSGLVRLHAYTRCGTGNCKHYAYEWFPKRNEDLTISVHSAGTENHAKALTKTTQVRGAERELLKEKKLAVTTVHNHKLEVITALNPKLVEENNWDGLKSDEAFRKMRSEQLQSNDLHKDDFIDIVLMRRKELLMPSEVRYIQSVAEPLVVHLFSESVLEIVFGYFKYKSKMTVHFDATGKFIRSSLYSGNTIYLYSCVVQVNQVLIQLFSMISCKHDQFAIGSILGHFRKFCENQLKKKWPCVARIVIDCSFAIIRAIMRIWNDTSLDKYLEACFIFCTGRFSSTDFSMLVLVRLCKNHWVKMVCCNLKGCLIHGKLKTLIVEIIMMLMECKTLKNFDDIFIEFAVILKTKNKCSRIVDAFKSLAISPEKLSDELPEPKVENISDLLDEHAFRTGKTLYDTSFHQHCLKMIYEVESYLESEEPVAQSHESSSADLENEEHEETSESTKTDATAHKNPFYCPAFFTKIFFKNHYAALLPLWTSLMDGIGQAFTASNAPAEGLFHIKKNNEHDELNEKPGRFIEIDKKSTFAAAKTIALKLRTDGKFFKEQDESDGVSNQSRASNECTNIDTINPNDSTEKWKPPPDAKFDYSQRKTVKRVASMLDSPVPKKISCDNSRLLTPTRAASKKILELAKKEKKIKGRTLSQTLGNIEFWHRKTPKGNKPSLSCNTTRTLSTSQVSKLADSFEVSVVKSEKSNMSVKRTSQNSSLLSNISTHYSNYLPSGQLEQCEAFGFGQSLFSCIPIDYRRFISKRLSDPDTILFTLEDDRPVYAKDLLQLFSATPLQSTIVDASLFFILRKFAPKSVFVGSHTDDVQIFKEMFSPNMAVNRKNILSFDVALVPHSTPGHWCLIYINLKSKTFSLLDPGNTREEEEQSLCQLFNLYVTKLSKGSNREMRSEFTVQKSFDYPHQRDDFNCGVYVIHYVESILRCGKCCEFDATEYRIELGLRHINAAMVWGSAESKRSLLHLSAHGNGLLKDPRYYCNSKDNFTVCIYNQGFAPVLSEHLSELINSKWINNWIINPAIYAFMQDAQRDKFVFVRSEDSLEAITGKMLSNHILCNISYEGKTVIMPINTSHNHWCLIIADCEARTYQFLDPLNLKKNDTFKDEFLTLLRKNKHTNHNVDDWTVSLPAGLPQQEDFINCGPFVVLYAAIHMNVYRQNSYFDILKFRTDIANKILEKCPSMTHLCLKCGKDEYRIKNESIGVMINCDACFRWWHLRCVSSNVNEHDDNFFCELCKLWNPKL